MTREVADILIEKAIDSAGKSVSFMFQGGEPTLAGLDYFEYFINKVKSINKKLRINYSIQTNGININEEFAEFFKANNFLVGLSLDGVKDINDFFRVDHNGTGTFNRIIKTARLFDKLKVDYNILTVVTDQTAKHVEKIYNFYKRQDFMYLQFIPCLEPLVGRDAPGVPQDRTDANHGNKPNVNQIRGAPGASRPTPESYQRFLITLFGLWHRDFMSGKYISIRFFDNLARIAAGYPSEQCGTLGFCSGQFVIESDGSVYPCDFYCVDNWKTGSILDMSFEELYNSPNMRKFRETSVIDPADGGKCKSCRFYYLCRGGCRRDRDNKKDGRAGNNIYCGALYNFYSFAEPYLKDIAKFVDNHNKV